jgi:ABC-type nitrate/sulfonate/bicarbonate transport system permease component
LSQEKPRRRWAQLARYALSIGIGFGIWQVIGASGDVFAITPPTDVIPEMFDEIVSGELLTATLGTLRTAAMGLGIAIAIGIPIGLLNGASKRASWVLDPMLNGAYAAPISILLPVIALYLGLGLEAKLMIVFLFCVFVIAINTSSGVRSVSPQMRDVGTAFGATRWGIATKIILRGASPEILTGLRLAVSRAVQGALLADLLLVADDLGLYLIRAGSTFEITRLLAGIFLITVVAVSLMFAARALESWLLRWKLGA